MVLIGKGSNAPKYAFQLAGRLHARRYSAGHLTSDVNHAVKTGRRFEEWDNDPSDSPCQTLQAQDHGQLALSLFGAKISPELRW